MASDYSMISALENQFNARLNQGDFGFGVAFSALMFSCLLFQVPLGRLSDRFGRMPFVIGGLILMAPATSLLGLIAAAFQYISLRVLQGLASAAIAAPAFALAADLSSSGGEGRQRSVITTGFGLGIAMGPFIAGALVVYNFALPFVIGGLLSLAGAWIMYRIAPETVNRSSQPEASISTSSGDD